MIQLRHTGLYVVDLDRMEKFYRDVFNMHVLSHAVEQSDALIHDLFRAEGLGVRVSKLLTEQGQMSRVDDMLELLQVIPSLSDAQTMHGPIYYPGKMHLGFGVPNIDATVNALVEHGGCLFTKIHVMPNQKKCCFLQGSGRELVGDYTIKI